MTGQLLSDYSKTPADTLAARTPRIPRSEDTILQEAQNLIALTNTQTPLLGGDSTPMVNSNFDSVTPQRQIAQTPNVVLKTPAHGALASGIPRCPCPACKRLDSSPWCGGLHAGFTPRRGDGTIAATPARDTLGINDLDGETPRMTRDDMV